MQGRTRLPRLGAEEKGEEIALPETANAPLIDALRRPGCYPHPVAGVELVETHISWVLLAGEYAYKLKKPVDFGFLDFSTIELRRRFCEDEVRLNRRTAPQIYLDVVAITGTTRDPRIGGNGDAIDWAVRMRRFRREDEFDALAQRGELHREHVEALAQSVSRLHDVAEVAAPHDGWGNPAAVLAPCIENFEQLSALAIGDDRHARLARLRQWTLAAHERLSPLIRRRLYGGRVRECHGDLHMANIVLIDGTPVLFDAIEFNPALRWIDVISDIAFAVMDLEHRGRHALAQRFLDAYLAHSGDYAGLALLPFHLVYRAIVRTKVAALRALQSRGGSALPLAPSEARDIDEHLALAEGFARQRERRMLLTHGVSGSGKSHVAGLLLEAGDWIRLRSDVERKRNANLPPLGRSDSGLEKGLYSPDATERTYRRLAELARQVLEAGYPVIVDATFLRASQRRPFVELAARMKLGWAILAASAPRKTLVERVARRAALGRDPSEATLDVLDSQLQSLDRLSGEELDRAIEVDTTGPIDPDAIGAAIGAATS